MKTIQILVALMPILLPLIFLVILRMPAKKGMCLTFIIFLVSSFTIWGMGSNIILASILQGVHKAVTILWILFGAILLLKVMTHTGGVNIIKKGFANVSGDMRVQAVIVGAFFVALIEGAAGFGTPAAVAGPFLIALGFNPLAAASIALIGDSSAVSFGAVGTPIIVGLGNIPGANPEFFDLIGRTVTKLDLITATLIPTIIIMMLTKSFGKKKSFKEAFDILPWSLLVGASYAGSALIYATFLGTEFVSILASLTGLIVSCYTAKNGILMPTDRNWKTESVMDESIIKKVKEDKNEISVDEKYSGGGRVKLNTDGTISLSESVSLKEMFSAWSPYIVVVGILLITRIVMPVKKFVLTHIDLSWRNILGEGVTSKWQVLYSPGTVLVIAAIIALISLNGDGKILKKAVKETVGSVKNASIALCFTLAVVQIFSNSINSSMAIGMPNYLADIISSIFQGSWFAIAPFLGELGSFITGSATVSTLTFSPIQYQVANSVGINPVIVLAQQIIGGAAGNMICIHNVVAAAVVVGLTGQEGNIIRKTLPAAIFYGIVVGILGFIANALM